MSYCRVWVHIVFSTKNREPMLDKPGRVRVFQHLKSYSRENGIYLDCVSGYSEHCHLLISLGQEQKIADIMRLLKGESSHWVNANNISRGKFSWQDDYYAASVSETHTEALRTYIGNQEQHHSSVPFAQEIANLAAKCGWRKQ